MHFVQGPLDPSKISEILSEDRGKTASGAYNFFLGRVRPDQVEGKTVSGIEFTAYESMAISGVQTLRKEISDRFSLRSLEIYHSLGVVKAGQICIFILLSAERRKGIFEATGIALERFKSEIPVFGKELFEDHTHQWKVNT